MFFDKYFKVYGVIFLDESYRIQIKTTTSWGRGQNKCVLSFGRETSINEIGFMTWRDTGDKTILASKLYIIENDINMGYETPYSYCEYCCHLQCDFM
jgi:hypothetical protein